MLIKSIFSLSRYRPAYKAFQNDSSANFMLFFFVFAFQFLVTVVQAIGVNMGSVGFITALHQFDSTVTGTLIGIFGLSIAIAFCLVAAGNAIMISKVSRYFGRIFHLIFVGFLCKDFLFSFTLKYFLRT